MHTFVAPTLPSVYHIDVRGVWAGKAIHLASSCVSGRVCVIHRWRQTTLWTDVFMRGKAPFQLSLLSCLCGVGERFYLVDGWMRVCVCVCMVHTWMY